MIPRTVLERLRRQTELGDRGLDPTALRWAWQVRLHRIVFHNDTAAGRWFDRVVLAAIALAVALIMLDGAAPASWMTWIHRLEWVVTGLFTAELALRLVCAGNPLRWLMSPFGLIDLLSVAPAWLGLLVPGLQSLSAMRVLRLLRAFELLRDSPYVIEGRLLLAALWASRHRVVVFLCAVVAVAVIAGNIAYRLESADHGFTSVARCVYWAIVTICTVGYGDIAPKTPAGQFLASVLMLIGYGVLAMSVTLIARIERLSAARACPACGERGHQPAARHCHACGAAMPGA